MTTTYPDDVRDAFDVMTDEYRDWQYPQRLAPPEPELQPEPAMRQVRAWGVPAMTLIAGLQPGERVTSTELAARFDLSPIDVRNALQTFVGRGEASVVGKVAQHGKRPLLEYEWHGGRA